MSACEALVDSCGEDWKAAMDHPFCHALADGTLPREKMAWYLGQEYLMVEQFLRLQASAVAYAPSLIDGIPVARFLGLFVGTEHDYFKRSFEALAMAPDECYPIPAPPTRRFQELLRRTRLTGRYESMIAVLLVVEWSYLSRGSRFTGYEADLPLWFADWIDLHNGTGLPGVVAYLQDQLNLVWSGLSAPKRDRAESLFREAVSLQRAYFDAAWAVKALPKQASA